MDRRWVKNGPEITVMCFTKNAGGCSRGRPAKSHLVSERALAWYNAIACRADYLLEEQDNIITSNYFSSYNICNTLIIITL
jgi:hypothetical protein